MYFQVNKVFFKFKSQIKSNHCKENHRTRFKLWLLDQSLRFENSKSFMRKLKVLDWPSLKGSRLISEPAKTNHLSKLNYTLERSQEMTYQNSKPQGVK